MFYYNNMKNELRSYHNNIDSVNFVWMQDFYNISWLKTLEIWQNFIQLPVVNTLFQEMTKHHNQEDGSKDISKMDPCWKLQPVTCMVNTEFKSELCLWTER